MHRKGFWVPIPGAQICNSLSNAGFLFSKWDLFICDEIPPLFVTHIENHEADGTIVVTFNEELRTIHVGLR